MPIQATCTCLAVIEVDAALAGRDVRCPSCHRVLRVNPVGVISPVAPAPSPIPVERPRSGSSWAGVVLALAVLAGLRFALRYRRDSKEREATHATQQNQRQVLHCQGVLGARLVKARSTDETLAEGTLPGECGGAWQLKRTEKGWLLLCPTHGTRADLIEPAKPPAEAPPK